MSPKPVEKFGVIFTLILIILLRLCMQDDVIDFMCKHKWILGIFVLYFIANILDYRNKIRKLEELVRDNINKIKKLESTLNKLSR